MPTEIMKPLCVILSIALFIGAFPMPLGVDDTQAMDSPTISNNGRALPTLTNVSTTSGLGGTAGTFYDWVDFNNDGYMDFMVDGRRLFQNSGPPGWTFTEVSNSKGLSSAGGRAVFGDYDNDGYIDLFEADWTDKLFHNKGPPNFDFEDVTVAAGNVRDTFPGTAASWGDYDNDGFLDLYIVNGEVWDPYKHYPDSLWKNDGDGTFTNVTITAGVDESKRPYYGRGATWSDYDNNGLQDLYISNYRLQPNYLYINNGNGTFSEMGKQLNAAGFGRDNNGKPGGSNYGHTIGSSWADLNNDGWFDIFVSNLAHKDPTRGKFCDDSNIYINQGFPYWNFTDIRKTSGIPTKPVGGVINGYYNDENWANAAIADFDNDGFLDVYIPQVYNFTWMYSYLYHNEGDLTFKNVSHEMGLDNVVDTYAGAWADYDNDGDMDLITAGRQNQWGMVEVTNGAATRLYKNDGGTNNWLKVKLVGSLSNKDGVGAKLTAKVGTKSIVRQVETGMGSHGQQNDIRVNFGLGAATKVDSLEIRWPSGIVQVLKDINSGQWINITEDTTGPRITALVATPTAAYPDSQIGLQATTTGSPATYYWDFEGDQSFDVTANSNMAQNFIAKGTWEYHPTLKVMNAGGTLGFFKATKVTISNMPPKAELGSDQTVFEDEDVVLNAEGSIDTEWDRANLTFQFFFGDGYNTSMAKDEVVTHNYTEKGKYIVTLEVADPFGATNTSQITVEVLNLQPTVEILTNISIPEDTTLGLDASGNDTRTDLIKGLKYRWDFGDGTPATSWSASSAVSHPYMKAGEYNITVSVKDDDGAIGQDNMTLVVYGLAPSVETEFKSIYVNEDELVMFGGAGNDTPSDVNEGLKFRWDFGDGNMSEWATEPSTGHAYTRNGTYTARLFVMDPEGLKANATTIVQVTNLPPTAEISEAPTDMDEDVEVEFIGKGLDTTTDMLSLQYKWEFGDGTIAPWSLSPSVKHSYNMSGSLIVVLYIKDNDGATVTAETAIEVVNPPPIADIIAPTKTTYDEDVSVSFEGNATDTPSDRGILNFTWTIEGGTYYGKVLDHVFTKMGSYEVTLKVSDDEKGEGLDTVTIKISNVKPKVTLTASKTVIKKGESVELAAAVIDTGSDMPLIKYTWECGIGSSLTGGNKANATCTFNTPGTNTVIVTVSDDEDGTDSASVKITVQPKGAGGDGNDGLSGMMVAGIVGAVVAAIIILILVLMFRKKGAGSAPRPKAKVVSDDEQDAPAKKSKRSERTEESTKATLEKKEEERSSGPKQSQQGDSKEENDKKKVGKK